MLTAASIAVPCLNVAVLENTNNFLHVTCVTTIESAMRSARSTIGDLLANMTLFSRCCFVVHSNIYFPFIALNARTHAVKIVTSGHPKNTNPVSANYNNSTESTKCLPLYNLSDLCGEVLCCQDDHIIVVTCSAYAL